MIRLAVRLDAVVALRRSPSSRRPDLHAAAHAALLGGADVVRLRLSDEAEALALRSRLDGPLHLDVGPGKGELEAAARVRPERVCLLMPDAPGPVATSRTLAANISTEFPPTAEAWAKAVEALRAAGVPTAIRVPVNEAAILAASEAGAEWVDVDTTALADAASDGQRLREFLALRKTVATARQLGLRVTVGGGLGPALLARVAALPEVEELHVGFVVVARALFLGLTNAVKELRQELLAARAARAAEGAD